MKNTLILSKKTRLSRPGLFVTPKPEPIAPVVEEPKPKKRAKKVNEAVTE